MPLGPQHSLLSEQLVHLLHIYRETCTLGEAAPKKKVAFWLELGCPLRGGAEEEKSPGSGLMS